MDERHNCPLRNTIIDDGDCFETAMASYGQHAKSCVESFKKQYPNFEKVCNSCEFNKEREEVKISSKVIGKYKYLGGESVSDLVIGNIYNRIEPEDEFRIIDDSGESYLYVSDNFQLILSNNIEIVKDNLTEMNVDAIVNAANNKLLRGSGLCGAIFQKAGYELDKECNEIGTCDTGKAVITKGYELKAKYIIHTVAPRWYMMIPEEEKVKQFRSCYKNIFRVAIEKNIKTIAIPCIGTGIYQCPIDIGRDLAFEEANKVADKFEKIYFVCFREEEYKIYSRS